MSKRTRPKTTELKEAEENIKDIQKAGQKKEVVDYGAFRRALNFARGNAHKISKFKGKPFDVPFIVVDANGVETEMLVKVYIKRLVREDYENYNDYQYQWENNEGVELKKPIQVMSRYASAVIVGAVDEDGNRLFCVDDAEILDSPLNIVICMKLFQMIIEIAGLTESAATLEKSE